MLKFSAQMDVGVWVGPIFPLPGINDDDTWGKKYHFNLLRIHQRHGKTS